MSKPSLRISPAMGEAVIAHLRKMVPLPSKGYVAGQAVSSAVMDLLGEQGGGVYNDVDLFFDKQHLEELWLWYHMGEMYEGVTPSMWQFEEARQNFYMFAARATQSHYGEICFSGQTLYRVASSHREGLLNFIACEFVVRENEQGSLLNGFDLNCVQVGVNLETQELFWTPSFLEFVDTKQLRVCTLQTPSHTAIRFVRKLAELPGVFGNVEQAMTLIAYAQTHVFEDRRGRNIEFDNLDDLARRRDRSYFFGEKTLGSYRQYEKELAPYFMLAPFPNDPMSTDSKRVGMHMLKAVAPLAPRFVEEYKRVSGYMDEAAMLAAVLAFEKHRPAIHGRVNQMLKSKSYAIRASLGVYGLSFVAGNLSESEIRMVDKYLAEHDQLPLHRLKTFTAMLEAVRLLRRLEKDFGRWVVGCAETFELDLFHELNGQPSVQPEDTLRQRCAEISVDMVRILTKTVIPACEMGGCRVRQLITRGDLVAEGERLHHCVGGYAGMVENGVSRIFSITSGPKATDCATLEIRKRTVDKRAYWYEAQLHSFGNSDAPHACKAAAKAVIDRINREEGVALLVIKDRLTRFISSKVDINHHRYVLKRRFRLAREKLAVILFLKPAMAVNDFDDCSGEDIPF